MNSDTLLAHLSLPESKRDLNWERRLLELMPVGFGRVLSDAPETGPDNFPYLLIEMDAQSAEPIREIVHWLSTRGIGLVVNPQKEYPDYIFTYGMIWNFKERGSFLSDDGGKTPLASQSSFEIGAGEKIIAGPPHPIYLPDFARGLLRQFFLDQGVLRPRILLVGKTASADVTEFDLCISLESIGNPPAAEHYGILKTVSWFLPQHYSLVLASEKGLPAFVDL